VVRPLVVALALLLGSGCGSEPREPVDADPPATRAKLRLSGRLEGRLEPCGCAGGQLGGLARRAFTLLEDRDYDLLIEGGDTTLDGTALDVQKLYTALTALDRSVSRYHALAVGPRDLAMPLGDLIDFRGGFVVPSVSSDLDAPADHADWPAHRSVEHRIPGGATVRIAALTRALPEELREAGFRLQEPADAWTRALEGIAADTLRVLLVHGSLDTARAAATLAPQPDLVVAIDRATVEPPRDPETVHGIPVVSPGTRGRFLLDVTIARRGGRPQILRYRPIPLRASQTAKGAMEDRDVAALVLAHRHTVEQLGLREELAERRPTATGADYVGSSRCTGCHPSAAASLAASTHARAWQTLERAAEPDRYGWPVTHYPDCVACHTVGYGEQTGFVSPERTPDLAGVGCEACHGPASAHVADPTRHALGPVAATACDRCHDFEQSPDFDYQRRWQKIRHDREPWQYR
jgi:hypothetical protein